MAGRPKAEIRKKAKAGDMTARLMLEELNQADNEKAFLEFLRVQPIYALRGTRDLKKLPWPSEHVRQAILGFLINRESHEVIAGAFGRTVEELRAEYGDELEHGGAVAIADVVATTVGQAVLGDMRAAIPVLKARADFSETSKVEVTGEDGGPVQVGNQSAAILARVLEAVDTMRRNALPPIDVSFKEVEK